MKIKAEMKVSKAFEFGDQMIDPFTWLAPEFERLNNPVLRKAMSAGGTVSPPARITHIPLTEELYVLNLSAGEDS